MYHIIISINWVFTDHCWGRPVTIVPQSAFQHSLNARGSAGEGKQKCSGDCLPNLSINVETQSVQTPSGLDELWQWLWHLFMLWHQSTGAKSLSSKNHRIWYPKWVPYVPTPKSCNKLGFWHTLHGCSFTGSLLWCPMETVTAPKWIAAAIHRLGAQQRSSLRQDLKTWKSTEFWGKPSAANCTPCCLNCCLETDWFDEQIVTGVLSSAAPPIVATRIVHCLE